MFGGERVAVGVEQLIIRYGPMAVFLAAMFEADVVPVLTGVAAHLGIFKIGPALFAAIAGAFAGDYLWFFLGVHYSHRFRTAASIVESEARLKN